MTLLITNKIEHPDTLLFLEVKTFGGIGSELCRVVQIQGEVFLAPCRALRHKIHQN